MDQNNRDWDCIDGLLNKYSRTSTEQNRSSTSDNATPSTSSAKSKRTRKRGGQSPGINLQNEPPQKKKRPNSRQPSRQQPAQRNITIIASSPKVGRGETQDIIGSLNVSPIVRRTAARNTNCRSKRVNRNIEHIHEVQVNQNDLGGGPTGEVENLDDSVQIIGETIFQMCTGIVQVLDDTAVANEIPTVCILNSDNSDVEIIEGPSTSTNTRRSNRKRGKKPGPQLKKKDNQSTNNNVCLENNETEDQKLNESLNGLHNCPICWDSLAHKEISSTICGHIFCTNCIQKAITTTKKCPTCRTSLTKKKVHPLFL